MIKIRTQVGDWKLTKKEVIKLIELLNYLEKNNSWIRREQINKELKISNKTLWQYAYIGFIKMRKKVVPRDNYNFRVYYITLNNSSKYGVNTIKKDLKKYIKYKEGLNDSAMDK